MSRTLAIVVLLTLSHLVVPVAVCIASEKPNAVLIYIDDLGYGDLGVYGCTDIPTTNIDRLATEGVRCTASYIPQPNDGQTVTEARVNLYSYPAGFGKGGEPFFDVAQENQEWLLMGDAVRDRDFYESGQGSAGLLILPEEWSEVKYGARPLLRAERSDAEEAQPWRLHWVSWIFPERGNAAAREYMRTNSDLTEERLKEVFR